MKSDAVLSVYRDHVIRTERARPKVAPRVVIQVRHRFDAPAQRVFDAWFDPAVAGRWLFATASHPMTHVAIDARVGGEFRFANRQNGMITEHRGEYVEILPHRRLVFDLFGETAPRLTTRVRVEITSRKKGCVLVLRHEHVPADHADQIEARWTGILYGLGETLAAHGRRTD